MLDPHILLFIIELLILIIILLLIQFHYTLFKKNLVIKSLHKMIDLNFERLKASHQRGIDHQFFLYVFNRHGTDKVKLYNEFFDQFLDKHTKK